MNEKEKELRRIVKTVVKCCGTEDGRVTIEDVLGKTRTENVVMTRCILAVEIIRQGYSVTTAAWIMGRTVQAVRQMLANDAKYERVSRAYRIAKAECRQLSLSGEGREDIISSEVSRTSGCTFSPCAFSQGVSSSI